MISDKRLFTAILVLASTLLASCDGSSNSNGSSPEIPSPARQSDILLFSIVCCEGEGRRLELYKFNLQGETILLSDTIDQREDVGTRAVSPDNKRVAYGYKIEKNTFGLKVLDIDSTEQLFAAPKYHSDYVRNIDWSSDSQSLVYFNYSFDTENGTISYVDLGENSTSMLSSGVASYEISGDSNLLSILIENSGVGQAPSADLKLLDAKGEGEQLPIDTVTGEDKSFRYQWSPYANELLYQARIYIQEDYGSGNYPAGPLVLMDADGARSQILPENDTFPAPFLPYIWLSEQRILLPNFSSFMVLTRDGRVLFEQSMSRGSLVVPSPDNTLLAYVDYAGIDSSTPEVYVLNIETGGIHAAGPASEGYLGDNGFDASILKWSEDGTMLAWNRVTSYEGVSGGELYVHNAQTGATELVTSDFLHIKTFVDSAIQSSYGEFDGAFSWLPGEALLEYVVVAGTRLELTLADPKAQSTLTVGEMAASLDTPCNYARAWRSSKEVMWNHCGEGVLYSQIDVDQQVTSEKVYDRDIAFPQQSKNLEFVVAKSRDLSDPSARGHSVVFDFVQGKMLKVEIPPGHSQPNLMTLLQ
jgi:hypothetical protein